MNELIELYVASILSCIYTPYMNGIYWGRSRLLQAVVIVTRIESTQRIRLKEVWCDISTTTKYSVQFPQLRSGYPSNVPATYTYLIMSQDR